MTSFSLIPKKASLGKLPLRAKRLLFQFPSHLRWRRALYHPWVPSPATCIVSVSPFRQSGETVSRPQASDAASRILSIPVTKCSQSLGKGRKKEGIEEGRTREEWEARELSKVFICLCIPICDRANFSQIP